MKTQQLQSILFLCLFISSAIAQVPGFKWIVQGGDVYNDNSNYVVTDASGNIYTVGRFNGTVDFDPGPGVFNLTGSGGFISKQGPSGNLIWAKGPFGDNGRGVAIDAANNIYITGDFGSVSDFDPGAGAYYLSPFFIDIFILKLDASGNFVWVKQIGGNDMDIGRSIAVDAAGCIYTAGIYKLNVDFDPGPGVFYLLGSGNSSIFVSKLDNAGNFIWAKSVSGGPYPDQLWRMVTDASANIYMTGTYGWLSDFDPGPATFNLSGASISDVFVSKWDSSGSFVWAKSLSGAGYHFSYDISVDASGNVLTTGAFQGTTDFDPGAGSYPLTANSQISDAFISKLDASGNFVFARQLGSTSNDEGRCIRADAAGNVYAAGSFSATVDFDHGGGTNNIASNGASDIYIVKYNSSGSYLWAKGIGGTESDYPSTLVIDNAGDLIISGDYSSREIAFDATSFTNPNNTGATTNFYTGKLNFNCAPPVTSCIAGGPTSFCAGNSVALSVTSAPGLAYQWNQNGINISGATTSNYTAIATGVYSCLLTDACMSTTSNSVGVSVTPAPPAVVTPAGSTTSCPGYSVGMSANSGTGLTYQWRLNGAPISGATFYNYYASSSGNYDCVVSNNCFGTPSNIVTVTFIAPPPTTISAAGPTTFCTGGSVTLNVTNSPGLAYLWYKNGSSISGATNSSYVATTSGSYFCVITNAGCSPNTSSITVTVQPAPPATISSTSTNTDCNTTAAVLSVTTSTGSTYQWRLNGNPISGATGTSYTAVAAGSYTCVVTNNCGSFASNSIAITVTGSLPTATISAGGPTIICSPGTVSFSVVTGTGWTYQWVMNGTGNLGGATNSTYTLQTTVSCTIQCRVSNACGSVLSNAIAVVVDYNNITPYVSFSGNSICAGNTVNMSVPTGTTWLYQWRKNTVAITGATNSTYSATTTGTYDCVITTGCGNFPTLNQANVTVTSPPSATITAGGATDFCQGGSVTLNANTGTGFTYQWRQNGTTISGATTSSYNATTSGNFDCIVSNSCGGTTSNQIATTVATTPTATITAGGVTTFCSGGSVTLNANTGTGFSYQWKQNNNSISGATNSSYVATAGGSYTCDVSNVCGTATSNQISVSVLANPSATISAGGATTFCTGGSVTLNANTGTGLNYQWRQNSANISGATNSSFNATVTGVYDCIVSNSCGAPISNQISVSVLANPSATISAGGVTTFCTGGSVTLNANIGTGLSYQWKQNGNSITGATNNSYLVTAGGSYTCTVSNSCGSITSNTIVVTVNASPMVPGSITGQASGVCSSTKTYTISAVAGSASYSWVVPAGASISSGQGTTSVNVAFSSLFGTGSITVASVNSCGTSGTSVLAVTAVPAMPGIITGSASVCHNQNNVNYSIAAVTGATSYTWTVPAGAQIKSGQGTTAIKVRFGNSAGNITVKASNACGSGPVRALAVAMPCREQEDLTDEIFEVNVYPNPTATSFTFETNVTDQSDITIRILDLSGRILETHESTTGNSALTCGENLPAGFYVAEIICGKNKKVVRLIKA